MATITAKYPGTCATCSGGIRPGDQIEYAKGQPTRHTRCTSAVETQASTRSSGRRSAGGGPRRGGGRAKHREMQAGERQIGRRSAAYTVGETVHGTKLTGGGGPDGCYWTVVHAWHQRANEDLGYYHDEHMAYVRPATEDEVAPVLARIATAGARKACEAWLDAALRPGAPGVEHISDTGTLPPAAEREVELVLGRKVGSTGTVTDGGTTYAVTATAIVAHHGGYYDDYRSSTRTLARDEQLVALIGALAANDAETIATLADRAEQLGYAAVRS